MQPIDEAKLLIKNGEPDKAIAMLSALISAANEHGTATDAQHSEQEGSKQSTTIDELYYIRGNAYRQMSNWHMATNDYLEAQAHNPDSPATEALDMMNSIFAFFNKDMYNH